MKIELELPDWVSERNLYVMAGVELVARKLRDGPWQVKTVRCNMCGRCCTKLGPSHPFPVVDGQCVYLVKEVGDNPRWLCRLGVNRPFGCCIGEPADCVVRWETVKS